MSAQRESGTNASTDRSPGFGFASTRATRTRRPGGRVAFDPGEEFAVPEPRVLRLQDPVVLVGKIDQPRADPARLERVVVLQSLRRGHAVVELAVNHKRGRLESARVVVR